MKKFVFLILSLSLIMASCTSHHNGQPQVKQSSEIVVNSTDVLAGQNFDLQALGEMVKKTSNPGELESMLNSEGSINNLDLDEDGNVDFIKVTEYGTAPNIGLSFTAVLSDGEPEIANIEINTQTQQVIIAGNETYYGGGAYYTSHYSPGDYLLFAYLMRPHVIYHSPYYYGHYGSYYRPYHHVAYGTYSNRSYVKTARTTKTYTKTTTVKKSTISSPNKTNVSKKATSTAQKKETAVKTNRSVSDTKTSQKSMEARDPNKAIGGGGFKKSTDTKNTTTSTKPAEAKKTSSSSSKPKSSSSSSSSSSSKSRSSSSKSSGFSSSRSSSSRKCDLNSKENIVKVNDGLSKALAMNVVNFNYLEKYVIEENLPSTKQIGFIAQEMQDILPEAVSEMNGMLAIDYAAIAANNTKAIQELNKLVQKQAYIINVLLEKANINSETAELIKEKINE